jgi:biotin carboxyl carrier protein
MRIKDLIISAVLIVALVASVAAFTMPSLLGQPMVPKMPAVAVPQLATAAAPQLPAQTLTPADVTAQAADETFSLRVSGNVYYDKLPVQGAEVTIYLNGRQVGSTTAGDIYMFDVPGVRMGDTVRVDASYQGFTGTASEVVKFKSMSLNVQITSGHSFIRDALDMLPTKDDISQASQEQASQPAASSATTPAASSATTSSADANQLTSQIMGNTANQLTNMVGGSNYGLTNPVALTDPGNGAGGMNINDIQSMINAGGVPGLSF